VRRCINGQILCLSYAFRSIFGHAFGHIFLLKTRTASIFRKNIGRALLNRDHDPFLPTWELDRTSRLAREKHVTLQAAKGQFVKPKNGKRRKRGRSLRAALFIFEGITAQYGV
jgi:hypothetical protein